VNERVVSLTNDQLYEEALRWKLKQMKRPSVWKRTSKQIQTKINQRIPEKFHEVVTQSVQTMVNATVKGNEYLPKKSYPHFLHLAEKEAELMRVMKRYQKTAALEGVGTGAGGLWLGLADFPLLLGIKMRFLFEAASLYGYDMTRVEERFFILKVFQLAFSYDERKEELIEQIESWDLKPVEQEIDWRSWQQEYRDHIDLVKMMQIIPGVGAVVGGVANYHLMKHLAEYTMYAYRLRILPNE